MKYVSINLYYIVQATNPINISAILFLIHCHHLDLNDFWLLAATVQRSNSFYAKIKFHQLENNLWLKE